MFHQQRDACPLTPPHCVNKTTVTQRSFLRNERKRDKQDRRWRSFFHTFCHGEVLHSLPQKQVRPSQSIKPNQSDACWTPRRFPLRVCVCVSACVCVFSPCRRMTGLSLLPALLPLSLRTPRWPSCLWEPPPNPHACAVITRFRSRDNSAVEDKSHIHNQ